MGAPMTFADELAEPMWTEHGWTPRTARAEEADLAAGWRLTVSSRLPADPLVTAFADLAEFGAAGTVPSDGPYLIMVDLDAELADEEHRIVVEPTRCRLLAGGVEGIRRAVFWVEEMMLAAGGPYLPLGEHHRTPVITTRISRCFFGPINRPPANRDELADDVDYYPEHYLNRLAHEGVNGLWLTVRFRDLVPTSWSGPVAVDPARRLAKLRRTVAACGRYGIKIFLFCIDPAAFGDGPEYLVPSAALVDHPELGGHRTDRWTAFCTNSEPGAVYVRDTLATIFSEVPGLGGLIDITIGERPTHCWSDVWTGDPINCPRCGPAGVGPTFAAHLTALRDGVRAGNPDARVISWMYLPYGPEYGPYAGDGLADLVSEIAAHTPDGVTTQVNLESTGTATQYGTEFEVLDYSLAWVGPSELFERVAETMAETGGDMGAKLQVGCSHEVATVPYVPVPGNLFRKYTALHELGVTSAMQCWYFGNAPGPMTRAAGRLAFAPLPATEDDFLTELAAPDWHEDTPRMVAAWQEFREAYARFPANLLFSWFGPVHDSIMWPWHLAPVDQPITPSWQLGWPPSGDRVGEFFAPGFSFDEIVELVGEIATQWDSGWQRIADLGERYVQDRDRRRDLGIAEAMNLQWHSAHRTLRFHQLREDLGRGVGDHDQQFAELAELITAERAAALRLAELADDDSRLGFHSEAEGHKYHPAGLRERAVALQRLHDDDLVRLRARADDVGPLWPGWAAPEPDDEAVVVLADEPATATEQHLGAGGRWRTWRDGDELVIAASLPVSATEAADEVFEVQLEARRLWPIVPLRVHRDGTAYGSRRMLPISRDWAARVTTDHTRWEAELRLPFEIFKAPGMGTSYGFRFNVLHHGPDRSLAWVDRAEPLRPRLAFEGLNPANLGWVVPSS
ncbi:hypothetical protein ACQCX1_07605 [Propionibacteriaceae bacterium Y2014]